MNNLDYDTWYLRVSKENREFLFKEGYFSILSLFKDIGEIDSGCNTYYYEVKDTILKFETANNDELDLSNQFYDIIENEVINITSRVLGPNWNSNA